jgi:hypothetical protein
MDQRSTATNNSTIVQSVAVRACELRLERRAVAADGTERVAYICGASGGPEHGHVLGVAGEDLSSMVATCNACPIPDALEARQSCLNLVPVRRFSGGKHSLPIVQSQASHAQPSRSSESVDTFFPCRFFYTLYGQNQPRDTMVCRSCPHWFPRPPRELIPHYWPETQKMLRVVNGEESTLGPPTGLYSPAPQHPPGRSWWQRLREKVKLLQAP